MVGRRRPGLDAKPAVAPGRRRPEQSECRARRADQAGDARPAEPSRHGRVGLTVRVDDVYKAAPASTVRLEAGWSGLEMLAALSPDIGAVSGALDVDMTVTGPLSEPQSTDGGVCLSRTANAGRWTLGRLRAVATHVRFRLGTRGRIAVRLAM